MHLKFKCSKRKNICVKISWMSCLALFYLQRNTTINKLLEVPFWSLCEVWILLWDQCGTFALYTMFRWAKLAHQPPTFQGYLTTIVWSALFHNLQQSHGITSQFTFSTSTWLIFNHTVCLDFTICFNKIKLVIKNKHIMCDQQIHNNNHKYCYYSRNCLAHSHINI